MTTDPRADNCKAYKTTANGEVAGIETVVIEHPTTRFRLARAEIIPELTNGIGGPTVVKFNVLSANGIPLGDPVLMAWPYPAPTGHATCGNPNNEHTTTSAFTPPALGPLGFYVADGVGNVVSDEIYGFGLPNKHHISAVITFQERGGSTSDGGSGGSGSYGDLSVIVDAITAIADRLNQLATHLGA